MRILSTVYNFAASVIPKDKINLPGGSNTGIAEVIRMAFVVAGIISVIVIIIAGIQFTLSSGDPGKVNTAKNSIIYALIGLAVCIFATTIVTFVIGATT